MQDTRCSLLQSDPKSPDYSNIASSPTSCILLCWIKTFVGGSIFVTDVEAVIGCRAELLECMGPLAHDGQCRTSRPRKVTVPTSSGGPGVLTFTAAPSLLPAGTHRTAGKQLAIMHNLDGLSICEHNRI